MYFRQDCFNLIYQVFLKYRLTMNHITTLFNVSGRKVKNPATVVWADFVKKPY